MKTALQSELSEILERLRSLRDEEGQSEDLIETLAHVIHEIEKHAD